MTNVIKPKRTSTASKVPTTSDLADGELGVNTADGKAYVRQGPTVYLVGEKNVPSSGTDLSIGANNGNTLRIDSSTGSSALLTGATTSLAGLMTSNDKFKLNSIETNATAYTDTLARAAVITSNITNGDTTHAPSGDAVFDAFAAKQNLLNAPNVQNAAYVIQASDAGKALAKTVSSEVSFTFAAATVAAGTSFILINHAPSANLVLVQGTSTNVFLAGSTVPGNRTIAPRGLAVVYCISPNACYVYGQGVT